MIRFLRERLGRENPATPLQLGPLEMEVMEILWERDGGSSVRDVADQLARPLAYTTVMTTLDRLFKKGMLDRRKSERAFYYSPRASRQEWERKVTGELAAGFLGGSERSNEALISSLVEAVGHDEALLDELEEKIRLKRKELRERGKS